MTFPWLPGAFDRLVAKNRPLGRLAERRSGDFARLLASSGRTGSPTELSRHNLSATLALTSVSVPAGLLLGIIFWTPLVCICLVPLAAYTYPGFVLKDAIAARREGVERELPFFAVLVNVLGGAGLPLYSIMESGVEKGIFRAMEKEALLVRRDVVVFGANPVDALERLAANHPSRKFADFVLGYCSKVRSGGDISAYLSGESGALLGGLESAWGRYASRVGTVGSLMVTVFGVVPLLLLVVGFFSPAYAVVGLGTFALAAVPLLSMALVALSGRMQPMKDDPLHGRWAWAVPVAALAVLPGLATGELWIAAALAMFSFCLVYGLSVRAQRRAMSDEEAALPRFLKDMMEFKRLEYDLGRSIVAISGQSRFGKSFDGLLQGLATKLRSGIPLDETRPEPKTPLGRIVFFVLGQMAYSGGGTVDTMFQLTHYTTRVIQTKEEARSEVRPYILLSYITPLLLVFGVAFVGGVLSGFGSSLRGSAYSGAAAIPGYALSPELFQVANLLIVVSAAALGVVGAKMGDLTVRNTLMASTNVAIAAAASMAVPLLNLGALLR